MKNHVAIAIGLLAGLALGLTASATGAPALHRVADWVAPAGTVFINLLRMVIVPLVAATLFSGVAGLGDIRRIGGLGLRTLGFFWGTTLVSIAIGMVVMTLLTPYTPALISAGTDGPDTRLPGTIDFILGLVPTNPVKAAADGALLPLIVFSVLFGAAAGTLSPEERRPLVSLADAVGGAMIRMVHWILYLAPVGVFALAAPVTAKLGWSILQSLSVFIGAVLLGLLILVTAVYLPIVAARGVRPAAFLRACLAPQAIGLSTATSAAALPAMLDASEQGLGASRGVASFVVPLGTALARPGSALFQGAAVVFLAKLYQVPLPLTGALGAWLATFLVSLTIAAVPSASVVTLAPALANVGIPMEGLAVLLGVDRIPDMFRTATNVTAIMAAVVFGERGETGRGKREA